LLIYLVFINLQESIVRKLALVGAKTGGFWRSQPFRPGLSKRKLIWVFPHEKKGYTYKAKVIKERGENITGQDQQIETKT